MSEYERKTEHVHIAMTPRLKDYLQAEADRRDQRVSTYIRDLLQRHSGYDKHLACQDTRRRMIDAALED